MKRAYITSSLRGATPCRAIHTTPRVLTATPKSPPPAQAKLESKDSSKAQTTPRKKTLAELDQELREKMEGMSGEGGGAGVEYENGKAEGLKRGVKSNMFRVI
ncbi:hypothetical protein FGRMN_6595 [Fusarium graminum]|nr:hypothetical protein FGRMN_6595 [Fusarium graminum]